MNPFLAFVERQGFVLLDGGLATELERHGYDLDDPLWSARLLLENPEAIARVHEEYLRAGADCVISASYQATVPGFRRRGLDRDESVRLIRRAVDLAVTVRDKFGDEESRRGERLRPLVAASVGPYGAYLANGAEYTGDYALDEAGLVAFHRDRWHALASSGADVLACETIPSAAEARALARLIEEAAMPAWVSFSCRDGARINDGTLLVDAVQPLTGLPHVVALGVNCTAPSCVPDLVSTLRRVTDKLIVAYPNSGETYDPVRGCWLGISSADDLASASLDWFARGARLIGGCCRTGPHHIRQMRRALEQGTGTV